MEKKTFVGESLNSLCIFIMIVRSRLKAWLKIHSGFSYRPPLGRVKEITIISTTTPYVEGRNTLLLLGTFIRLMVI